MPPHVTMISSQEFECAAMQAFRPLHTDFGFETAPPNDYVYRCVKPPVWIEATYQPNTHELNIWVGDNAPDEPPLELSDVLRATDCPPEQIGRVGLMQTGDVEVLTRLMNTAVELLMHYGAGSLRGDPHAFTGAREILLARSTEYTNQVLARSAIASAELRQMGSERADGRGPQVR